jgi:hypothetical protein
VNSGVFAVTVAKGVLQSGNGFSFALPEQVVQGSAGVPAQVTTVSGGALPTWLRFDPQTNTFVATAVPESGLPLEVVVTVGGRRTVVVVSVRSE